MGHEHKLLAKVLENAQDYQFIDSLRELDRDIYHVVIVNADTFVVPLGKGLAGHLRAAQTRLMHAFSSKVSSKHCMTLLGRRA